MLVYDCNSHDDGIALMTVNFCEVNVKLSLCLINHHDYALLTSVVDGGGWPGSSSGSYIPRDIFPVTICIGGWINH